jgi:hypothetical protein
MDSGDGINGIDRTIPAQGDANKSIGWGLPAVRGWQAGMKKSIEKGV